jgi:hypothetical protein
MISGGDLTIFLVAVLIVIVFFIIMRRFLNRADQDSDSQTDGHSGH